MKKNRLVESGFSRVRGMMLGLVPSIETIGIMTEVLTSEVLKVYLNGG